MILSSDLLTYRSKKTSSEYNADKPTAPIAITAFRYLVFGKCGVTVLRLKTMTDDHASARRRSGCQAVKGSTIWLGMNTERDIHWCDMTESHGVASKHCHCRRCSRRHRMTSVASPAPRAGLDSLECDCRRRQPAIS